ncbi:hypothetical protein QQ045_015443 [Rhodiola kirilowii]
MCTQRESCAESHLSLAFLDVAEASSSFSSTEKINRMSILCVEEYLKGRWEQILKHGLD